MYFNLKIFSLVPCEGLNRKSLRATLSAGGSASSDPARVQEPGVGLVVFNLVREHSRVAHRVKRQKRLSEAG